MRIEDVVVGKTYRIRQWDDMKNELGECWGELKTYFNFASGMKELCGEICKVTAKRGKEVKLEFINDKLDSNWAFSCDMIEPIEENKMPIEIKPGYIVVFLDKGLLTEHITVAIETNNGYIYCADDYGWYDFKEDFPDGMENESFKIVKVYGLTKRGSNLSSVRRPTR